MLSECFNIMRLVELWAQPSGQTVWEEPISASVGVPRREAHREMCSKTQNLDVFGSRGLKVHPCD